MRSHLIVLLILCFYLPTSAHGEVRLANIFGDHMVLQRDKDLKFFGWGDAGKNVTVKLRDQSVTTTVDADGRWVATLKPIQVGDAFDVKVIGVQNEITLKDCVAGEVWICSGQSNMEWWVNRSANPQEEIANANYPLIRHCDVTNKFAVRAQADVQTTGWEICSPETAGDFTAVGYYFARKLHGELNVPVGLINTTWGGTIVEAWTSAESLSTHPDFAERMKQIEAMTESDEELAKRQQVFNKWQQAFNKAIQTNLDGWQKADTDDSNWKAIKAPGHWEQQGYANYDGVAWYRKTVKLPAGMVGKPLKMSLARIDDFDITFVNGTQVGTTRNWNALRKYNISENLTAGGSLQIAIRVVDTGVGGGIHGNAYEMKLESEAGESVSLAGDWKFKQSDAMTKLGPAPKAPGFNGPNNPSALYNSMVNGLIPVTFRGAIWYQGESNAGRAYQYRSLFPLMINDWRAKWGEDFPFYWVQLANFMAVNDQPMDSAWAELREAQSMTLSLKNSGEAVIIDIGEARDIHPKNKQDVGKRLALHALHNEYGQDIVYSGPRYKSMRQVGNEIHLTFDYADGLAAKDGELKRFSIAGEDKKFVWAQARIENGKVIVSAENVDAPVAVRYAWANNPEGCNLVNGAGLPASPFRTDTWKGVTQR